MNKLIRYLTFKPKNSRNRLTCILDWTLEVEVSQLSGGRCVPFIRSKHFGVCEFLWFIINFGSDVFTVYKHRMPL